MFNVDADYVRSQILPSLIGHMGRYANHVNPVALQEKCIQAARETEQKLSTRFQVTRFQGWLGPGARPANVHAVAATDSAPAVEALEYEGPYQWPNMSPSDGYLSWRLRVRPITEILGGFLHLPGTTTPGIKINSEWMSVNPYGEIVLMPQYGASALFFPNLPAGLFPLMQQRIGNAMVWEYRAGMTESDWELYPQINRLVGLRAAIKYLPTLSLLINPTGVTSKSADGLSLSRASGYVFKDIEERLTKEADDIQTQVLDAWDGTSALGVL